jgi:hypothetical protein
MDLRDGVHSSEVSYREGMARGGLRSPDREGSRSRAYCFERDLSVPGGHPVITVAFTFRMRLRDGQCICQRRILWRVASSY